MFFNLFVCEFSFKSNLLQRCVNSLLSDTTGTEIIRICVACLNHMGRLLRHLFTEKSVFHVSSIFLAIQPTGGYIYYHLSSINPEKIICSFEFS